MKTKKLSDAIGITADALRHRLCLTGSYFGVVPTRLPNGWLDWPDDSLEQLKETRTKGSDQVTSLVTEATRNAQERSRLGVEARRKKAAQRAALSGAQS